ncbi:tyrosine-protein phosphatase, partial [Aldersonia kunmingensis]|uniref:tyrosine-protein phosphatase n=1 Tax=Aldersonia kunmingensis TaxID=408066 RepID=UPI0016512002
MTRADTSTHDQFRLSGAWNFRDLGGLRTDDGASIAPGLVFRSSHLALLDVAGQRSLAEI